MSLVLPIVVGVGAWELFSSRQGRVALTQVQHGDAPFRNTSNRLVGKLLSCPSKWQGDKRVINSDENHPELGNFFVIDLGKNQFGEKETLTVAHLRAGAISPAEPTNPDCERFIYRPEFTLGGANDADLDLLALYEYEKKHLEGEEELRTERIIAKLGEYAKSITPRGKP